MPNITVIAHNIRSSHNVGSIFRTCEGFGIHKLILSGYTPYPKTKNDTRLPHIIEKLQDQIHKTALGAETMVNFEHYEQLDDWLEENRHSDAQLPVIALEQLDDSQAIHTVSPKESFALLLGEEVHGIEAKYLQQCSQTVEIPMRGKKESFNVSVACGIALYALSFNGHAFSTDHTD